ncbi:hypothetical protein M5689_011280 [Euphorbia peplus]|nr:hypothetical protein M5689_011280 [Euphorbia peplus]
MSEFDTGAEGTSNRGRHAGISTRAIPVGVPLVTTALIPEVRIPAKRKTRKKMVTGEGSETSGEEKKKKKPPTKVVRSVPPYTKGILVRPRPGRGVRPNRLKICVEYPPNFFGVDDTLYTRFVSLRKRLWPEKAPLPRNLSRPKNPSRYGESEAHSVLIREDVACIAALYRIGGGFLVSACGPNLRANMQTVSFRMVVYEHQFQAGMWLPLLPFFVEVLMEFNLAPGQIGANGWRTMVGFYSECRNRGFRPTGLVFRQIFKPNLAPASEFVLWNHSRYNFMGNQPNKVPEGRHHFFAVEIQLEDVHFPFPVCWNPCPDDPRTWLVERDLLPFEKELMSLLDSYPRDAQVNVQSLVENFIRSGWYVISP